MNRTRRRTRGNKRRNKKTFKQKIYNMKGCSKSQRMAKSRMQYISKTKGQSKGRGFGQGRGIGFRGGSGSNPLIGSPWSVDQTSLSNYYANNLYDGKDVQTQMQLNGGRRRNKRRRLKGGGITDFVPSGITNLGRDLMYNSSSAYSSLVGADQPVNPSATHGQLTSSIAANRVMI
jgi:hypothetical protein